MKGEPFLKFRSVSPNGRSVSPNGRSVSPNVRSASPNGHSKTRNGDFNCGLTILVDHSKYY